MDSALFIQNEPDSGSRELELGDGKWQMANDEWQMAETR
jgi:hypothetical protein